MPIRVVLRADASQQIGLGHVKRCLSLASALQSLGAEVLLLTRDLGVDVAALADEAGVRFVLLPRPAHDAKNDTDVPHGAWAELPWADDVADCVSANAVPGSVDWIVVDHYSFDERWHKAAMAALKCRIAVIDDLADRMICAALVIDHNHDVDHASKYARALSMPARILGGPRFALISHKYSSTGGYVFREHVSAIGIFMGGIDAGNWTSKVWGACRQQARFTGHMEIAVTSANPHLLQLKDVIAGDSDTHLNIDLPDLAGFFSNSDLQIGAGGGAMWERCKVGVPALVLACADNQVGVISSLAAIGAIAAMPASDAPTIEAIGARVAQLVRNPDERRLLSANSRSLVDGQGAVRVAIALLQDCLSLRPATMGDAGLLHGWRNHPATRAMSVVSTTIEWATHLTWLQSVLHDPDRRIFIGCVGGHPVGAIRLDGLSAEVAEVSLYLDPGLHGLGLGGRLLGKGEEVLIRSHPGVKRLVATVLDMNLPSRRMFEKAGYSSIGKTRLSRTLRK
jgi:UDP-2,4-diacetamido-2,4,6-trideoxy-beta-L-altropyranose hydrolase